MKKRPFKIVLGAFILALTMLGSSNLARAFSPYDQSDFSSSHSYGIGGGAGIAQFTITGIPSGVTVTSITVKYRLTTTAGCTPGFGGIESSSPSAQFEVSGRPAMIADGAVHNITFDTKRVGGDFSPMSISGSDMNNTWDITGAGDWGSCTGTIYIYDTAATSTYVKHFVSTNTSFTPYVVFNGAPQPSGGGTGADSTHKIVFQDPPLTQNFTSADFNNWQNCVYMDTGGSSSSGSVGYYVAISYGTSTLNTFFDRTKFGNSTSTLADGLIPIYHLPVNECVVTNKLNSLPPGDYQAQAGLYEQFTLTGNTTFVASSSILNFTIASGTPVGFVGQSQIETQVCQPTDFSIFSVDFGYGICKVATYLFYPSQETFTRYTDLWGVIKNKPPFGYFIVSQTELNNLSTSTPASVSLPNLDAFGALKTAIDAGFALLVSASFLMYLFHRFKKMDFHQ